MRDARVPSLPGMIPPPRFAGRAAKEARERMNRRIVLSAALPALALGACARGGPDGVRGEPIRNLDNVPFLGRATAPQREDQIQRGALSQRWVVEQRGPRLLRATTTLRRYGAVVDIPYNTETFSIRYVSSTNLEQSPGFVLRDYNEWVERLQRAIVTGR